MEVKKYTIEIRGLKAGAEEVEIAAKKEAKTNAQVTGVDIGKAAKKTVATVAVAYATMNAVARPIVNHAVNNKALSGDIVQAENINKTFNNVNKFVNIGFEAAAIGVSFLLNPALGLVTLGGSIQKHVINGINMEEQNRVTKGILNQESFMNSYEAGRMAGE